ncbi:hypothetical protein OMP38_06470 [Cohnella ginsengisoli]|uniref:Uncharacterized protein n=1 Tax=Cohnella ginsengisoli TaxID=425004 RepID=A0A9X4KI62_9BACL|nr:hypothetical protein [Cohnella ginsengisoli]MDG0790532.1 hypothetical protein [Cohnella ginsengisoli]
MLRRLANPAASFEQNTHSSPVFRGEHDEDGMKHENTFRELNG